MLINLYWCLVFTLNCLVLSTSNTNEVPFQLRQHKSQIQQDVQYALQDNKAGYLPKYYQKQEYTIVSYPTYYYAEPVNKAVHASGAGIFQADTTSSYAALFVKGKLALVARSNRFGTSGRRSYSFYPVNPPLSDKGKGLGSRDSTDYDIKLVNATLPYKESAFIYLLLPNDSPTLMGFYRQNKLQFVDADGHCYTDVDALIKSKYGSKEQYFKLRSVIENNAKSDAEWRKSNASPYFHHK